MGQLKCQDSPVSLEKIEKDCWIDILNGSLKPKDAFRTLSLATYANDTIGLRTVVLRKVLPGEKTIFIFTDSRSRKCREITQNQRVSALFYNEKAGLQISIRGMAKIRQEGERVEEAWKRIPLHGRKDYSGHCAPSTKTALPDVGFSDTIETGKQSMNEDRDGSIHFAVIEINVYEMEWLQLGREFHLRASFRYNESGVLQESSWLVP